MRALDYPGPVHVYQCRLRAFVFVIPGVICREEPKDAHIYKAELRPFDNVSTALTARSSIIHQVSEFLVYTRQSMMAQQHDEKAEIEREHRDGAHDVGDAVQLAQEIEAQKASPWTPSMFRLYAVLAFAYLCGCLV